MAEANNAKHGIPFELAVRVFDDPFRFEIEDDRFDYGEERIITLGLIDSRVYVVIYTPRDDRCRIISARKANARESRRYHDLQTRQQAAETADQDRSRAARQQDR